jgi:hypothetical protein
MKMKSSTITTIVLVIVVSCAAFFGGMKYQESRTGIRSGQFNRMGGVNGNGYFMNKNGQTQGMQFQGQGVSKGQLSQGFRPVNGEITAIDNNSITVKMQDGSSKIVVLSNSTAINKTDTAAKSDLKLGDTIGVFGTENSDGTVNAQNIQLNPQIKQIQQ